MADRVQLLRADGTFDSWLSEDDARRLMKAGQVELLGTKSRIRVARMVAVVTATADERLVMGRSGPARRKYSHNRETKDNPHGVWTLVPIHADDRRFFGLCAA